MNAAANENGDDAGAGAVVAAVDSHGLGEAC